MKKIIFWLMGLTMLEAHIDEKVLYAFKKKCMVCHDTYKKNDKAPPLVAVNQVYLRLSDNNFTLAMEKMETFLEAPDLNKTLMNPAVKLFGVMPKLDLNRTQIKEFSQVLIETEFEIPEWFEGHFEGHDLNHTPKKIEKNR